MVEPKILTADASITMKDMSAEFPYAKGVVEVELRY